MGRWSDERFQEIEKRHGAFDVFVETGTGDCATVQFMNGRFRHIHSIELSDCLFADAERKFGKSKKVTIYHGSSPHILEELMGYLPDPTFFYLDAHWCGDYAGKASSKDPFPLWRELEVLSARPQADLVVIDDVHCFSKPFEGHKKEWETVNPGSIDKALGRVKESYQATDHYVVQRTAA